MIWNRTPELMSGVMGVCTLLKVYSDVTGIIKLITLIKPSFAPGPGAVGEAHSKI